MALSAAFTINGVAVPAAVAVPFGSEVTLAFTSITGIGAAEFSIAGLSKGDLAIPTLVQSGTPLGQTAKFTMPADPGDGLGRGFLIKGRVSDELEEVEIFGVVGSINVNGNVPLVAGEELDRDPVMGWTEVLNQALATVAGAPNLTGFAVFGRATSGTGPGSSLALNQNEVLGRDGAGNAGSTKIKSGHIDTGAIVADKIGFAAVTSPAIAAQAVKTAHIDDKTITAPLLDDNAGGFPTMAQLRLAAPENARVVRTASYAAKGDGGGGTWVGVTGAAEGTFTHNGGTIVVPSGGDGSAAWLRDFTGDIYVAWFGASGGLVNDAGAAIQSALDAAEALGGGVVRAPAQFYRSTTKLRLGSGVSLVGSGVDEWEPVFPSRPKGWNGTSLVFAGTGTRDLSCSGVTSMRYAGGWREDPDSLGTYFKLTSFTEADASGTTPATQRQFSAAIANKPSAHSISVRDLRIVNWVGADGIDGHSDTGLVGLGDEWDIGLALVDSENALISNVQAVGYWREFGHLEIATAISESRSERNLRVRCKFQGRVGVGTRGPDRWSALSATSNSVTVRWSEESYWGSTGSFRGNDNVSYSYTGTSRSTDNLVFTGVTPDPSALFEIRHPSAGFANGEFHDCYSFDLYHVSGAAASSFGLSDSRALELSGNPLRGLKFRNFKAIAKSPVVAHFHDLVDAIFVDPQFEGGGHLIASPATADAAYVPAPRGDTRNLVMLGDVGLEQHDLRLFLPRTGFCQSLQLSPRADLSGDLVITPLRAGKDVILAAKSGQSVRVRKANGDTAFRVTDAGNAVLEGAGQLTITGGQGNINVDAAAVLALRQGSTTRLQVFSSGNVGPGADGSQTLGTSGMRWSLGYFAGLRLGAGATQFTSGTGSPEGVVTAPVGSMFLRTDGGAGTTLYVKESGAGNTGWVGK